MTERFPHPYTRDAAQLWVDAAIGKQPTENYVIEVDGALAGGIGLRPHAGESAGVAEFGYWLGRDYWGRGIATEAARLLTAFAFARRKLRRLEAHVFAPNVPSAHVLEKCGFVREAVLREAFIDREGAIVDGLLYALLASQERRGLADSYGGVSMLDHTSIGVRTSRVHARFTMQCWRRSVMCASGRIRTQRATDRPDAMTLSPSSEPPLQMPSRAIARTSHSPQRAKLWS